MKTEKNSTLHLILFRSLVLIVALMSIVPLLLTAGYSFFHPQEIDAVVTNAEMGEDQPRLIPQTASLHQYYQLIIGKPKYMRLFWNSVTYTAVILVGQLLLGFPTAYVITLKEFRFRRQLYLILLFIMLMPFQVVMVPNYIGLKWIGLLETPSSVMIPFIFSPFTVVLLSLFMSHLPRNVIDAADIDGTGTINLMLKVVLPLAKPGIAALFILSFVDAWNMVEQPLVFLRDEFLYPLSLALGMITEQSNELAFAASFLYAVPPLYLFLIMRGYLLEGINTLGTGKGIMNET